MINIPEVFELKFREEVENISCEDITEEEMQTAVELGKKMIEFAVQNGGVGLSAPQIGILKNIIIWEGKENIFHIGFNPQIYPDGKIIKTVEGCLSYPGETYYLERYKEIRAVYYVPAKEKNELFKVTRKLIGNEAIKFQHERHHLQGITISMIGKKI